MAEPKPTFEKLPRTYKGAFPFRICAPSFIYPASWTDNIRLLGPCLDEIEVLLFDSVHHTDFPSKDAIEKMSILSEEHAVTYNVHLPIDINPGSLNAGYRQRAIETLIETYQLVAPLNPTATILHLPWEGPATDRAARTQWRRRIEKSVESLIVSGVPAEKLSVETLDYPLDWVAPIIDLFDLRVCLDLGHLFIHEVDWVAVYEKWAHRINMVHLHGVSNGRDHLCLDKLAKPLVISILDVLASFKGTVSIEVFSYDALKHSLSYFEKNWQEFGKNSQKG